MDKVQHFEIPADDVERAKKFYSEVFGWKISDVPGMNYTLLYTAEVDKNNMAKEKGVINGGMMERGVVKSPVIVVTVASIEESLEKIKAAGGEAVTEVMTVGDMGLYSYVKDPEGNIIGIWQNLRPM